MPAADAPLTLHLFPEDFGPLAQARPTHATVRDHAGLTVGAVVRIVERAPHHLTGRACLARVASRMGSPTSFTHATVDLVPLPACALEPIT